MTNKRLHHRFDTLATSQRDGDLASILAEMYTGLEATIRLRAVARRLDDGIEGLERRVRALRESPPRLRARRLADRVDE